MLRPPVRLPGISTHPQMYSTLPVIDFGNFCTGSIEDRKRIASEIDHALGTVGFFYLLNHGISKTSVDACFESVGLYLHKLERGLIACERANGFSVSPTMRSENSVLRLDRSTKDTSE
jgi:hypothetical protein